MLPAAALDFYLIDGATRDIVLSAAETGVGPETLTGTNLPAGTYYLLVDNYTETGTPSAAAVPYSIVLTLP